MAKENKIRIRKEKFAIVQSSRILKGAFANIDDGKELTSIIDQKKLKQKDAIKSDKDYRIITFSMILPFEMVGFISKVSAALAKEKIPIFLISAYSTDHVLVKQKYLNKAVKEIKKLKF